MRRLTSLLAVLVLALAAAGCGGGSSSSDRSASPGTAEGFLTPNTAVPYETGGADGSGADGSEATEARGGIGGGTDTQEPGERPGADAEIKPPRNNDDVDSDG
jgi:hypothetical protein